MAATGIAQNLKEENVIVARGVGATSVQSGHGQATSPGALSWEFRDDSEIVGSSLIWDVLVARERNTNCRGLEIVAHVGRFLEGACQFRFFVRFFRCSGTRCGEFELKRFLKVRMVAL